MQSMGKTDDISRTLYLMDDGEETPFGTRIY
jgi:hypothetical protein